MEVTSHLWFGGAFGVRELGILLANSVLFTERKMAEKKIRALRTWFGIFFSFIFLSKMCHPVRQQYPKLPHFKTG
jgi:hypothetical protein